MGKGMDDGDRANTHRLCLRSPSGAMSLEETPGPGGPAPRGGEDTVTESKPAPKKGKTNYPHPTSTLCPPPPRPRGTLPRGIETAGPHLPYAEPRLSTAERGVGGLERLPPATRPCPWAPHHHHSARTPAQGQVPQGHTPRGKGRSWLRLEDGRKKQRFEGSNLSSATLGDLRQVI